MALNDIFCVPLKLRLEDTIARQYKTKNNSFVLFSLIRTSDFVEGTSARQNKRKTGFPFVLFSLIRTFALKIRHLII